MDLELKPATDSNWEFAWSLYGPFVRTNLFSGAPGRRPSLDWQENTEREKFRDYWAEGNKYVITVDQVPVGWVAIIKDLQRVCIENWHTGDEWRNKNLAKIILGDLLPKWRAEGLQVEASVLQDTSLSAAENVLSELGFAVHKVEGHTTTMILA